MEKKLGKISRVRFGYVGYQDMQFGLSLDFSCGPFGVGTTITEGCALDMECTETSKWTEEDRTIGFGKTMRRINQIMKEAKVTDINDLEGKPVELTFDGIMLKDWRILTEVL